MHELGAESNFSLKGFLGNDCRTKPLGNTAMFQMTHECGRQFSVVVNLKDELVLKISNEILNFPDTFEILSGKNNFVTLVSLTNLGLLRF